VCVCVCVLYIYIYMIYMWFNMYIILRCCSHFLDNTHKGTSVFILISILFYFWYFIFSFILFFTHFDDLHGAPHVLSHTDTSLPARSQHVSLFFLFFCSFLHLFYFCSSPVQSMYACVYVYVCVCACVHTYITYTFTHTHAHAHTDTQTQLVRDTLSSTSVSFFP
jgi:hypothetical protein